MNKVLTGSDEIRVSNSLDLRYVVVFENLVEDGAQLVDHLDDLDRGAARQDVREVLHVREEHCDVRVALGDDLHLLLHDVRDVLGQELVQQLVRVFLLFYV